MMRLLSRISWAAVPVVLASLVLAAMLVEFAKPANRFEAPVTVAIGSWGRPDKAVEVRVNQVRTGSVLLNASGSPAGVSQGWFVVVNLSLRVDRLPKGSVSAQIRTRDGIVHRAPQTPSYEPGFTITSDVPFELPVDDLQGAVLTVRVARDLIALERVIVVDLGYTKQKVDATARFGAVKLTDEDREAYR